MPEKKKSFYSKTPAVPAKKIAGLNPVGSVGIGSDSPPMVPKEPGGMSTGLGSKPKHFFKIHLKPHKQHGHLRTSGHVSAHRVGGRTKGITKVP